PAANPLSEGRSARDLLAPLPKEKLPPRTRPAPDPAKDRFSRDPVFVRVGEVVTPREGPDYVPDVLVVQNYLQAYFARAGHPAAAEAEKAAWRIEGSVKLAFHTTLQALGKDIAWKYRAEATIRVLDASGEERDRFEIPEAFRESTRSETSAVLEVRRYLAKVVWDRLFHQGKFFGNPKAEWLLNSLALEGPSASTEADRPEPATGDETVAALAGMGLEAVPHLIEALVDDRPILKKATYPGLTEETAPYLRVYHLADKALEEIFQKVSRLSLETERTMTPREKARVRAAVIAGWENEWSRFCPSFVPSALRAKAGRPAEGLPGG
ncbi:MAG: hypothetical protein ACUVYA_02320, partial [Planctomycetota bacterium]